jgi:subtilisin family serine protease
MNRKKWVIPVLSLFPFCGLRAQTKNWQHLDLQTDGIFGISTNRAFAELLRGRQAETVVVAVIDSGVDTAQPALKGVIWTNPREIPGNNTDDDHNGYVDDVHGWNYLGIEKGKEDITRLVLTNKSFYDSLAYAKVPETYQASYQQYRKWLDDYQHHVGNLQYSLNKLAVFRLSLDSLVTFIGKNAPAITDFMHTHAPTATQEQVRLAVLSRLPLYPDYATYVAKELDSLQEAMQFHIDHGLSLRGTRGTKEENMTPGYGNGDNTNDLAGPVDVLNATSSHGTHVTGIIAGTGAPGMPKGIGDHVQVMMLKALSSIRELRDRDLALAIRYAVDNGAKVINLSLGKPYSPDKALIDEAVRYAMSHDVLIVAGAGNAGRDLDKTEQYPSRVYLSGDTAQAWLEVGASGPKDDSTLVPSFSNYGQRTVDVFAPGVDIYSSMPDCRYAFESGTSMATPVVAGLAALIREYYPGISAAQVKNIIVQSVSKVPHTVTMNDENGNKVRIPFSRLCVSGGIVNAYQALLLAEKYK